MLELRRRCSGLPKGAFLLRTWRHLVDDAMDNFLDIVLFEELHFVRRGLCLPTALNQFDILKVIDLRDDDVFLEVRQFHLNRFC